jgi:hypothetical protein
MPGKISAEREELGEKLLGAAVRQPGPIFANVCSYSGVHRSGMSSDAGHSVDRAVTAHRQGLKRGAGTSTVPNSEFNRRVRVSFSGRRRRQCEQRRRSTLYSATLA